MGLDMEFVASVERVIRDVRFDADLDVSVFETNIRVLGGLLGAHSMMLQVRPTKNTVVVAGHAIGTPMTQYNRPSALYQGSILSRCKHVRGSDCLL